MDKLDILIANLSTGGKNCSQIMCELMYEMRQERNEEVIKGMLALGGGVQSGKMCGIITGGAVSMALLSKDESPEEKLKFKKLINEYVNWFENSFGSTECIVLDPEKTREGCRKMMKESFFKILDILEQNDIDMYD